jgi:hypothetical protein
MIQIGGRLAPADFEWRPFLVNIASKALIIPALFAGVLAVDATASPNPGNGIDSSQIVPAAAEMPLRLAQSGDVEIYIDEYGRRVIVDAFTGEVLGIQRPRQNRDYRHERRLRELNRDQGGFLLEDPDADIPYKPRPYYNGRPAEEYPEYSRQPDAPEEAFPDAPQEVYPNEPAYPAEPQPRVVTREPIERQPLDDGTVVRAPTDVSPPPAEGSKEPAVVFFGRAEVAGLQVLLDRKGASPGVIDGHFGSNVDNALAAYRDITGQNLHSTDTEAIKKGLAETGGDTFTTYTITPEDAAGPFVASVPADYSNKAKLDRLSYT